jgi:predicted alpha/beta hydrolase family esterase
MPAAAQSRPLVLIVHAFGGPSQRHKFWYSWLESQLRRRAGGPAETQGSAPSAAEVDVEVSRVTAPPSDVDGRVEDLAAAVSAVAAATAADTSCLALYLVGHSVGCQTILRYLSTHYPLPYGAHLQGVLCVAGWFAVVDPWDSIRPWCERVVDGDAVRAALLAAGAPLRLLLSDNDKYTPDFTKEEALWHARVGGGGVDLMVRVIHGRAHFGGRKQHEVLEAVLAMLSPPPPPPTPPPSLPSDMLVLVLSHLGSAVELGRAESVCRSWLAAARAGAWAALLRNTFPLVAAALRSPSSGLSADATAEAESGDISPPPRVVCHRWLHYLASRRHTCARCHQSFVVGHNGTRSCGWHPGPYSNTRAHFSAEWALARACRKPSD